MNEMRFVRRLSRKRPLPFRRIEVEPGQEVQVDFGRGAPVERRGRKRRRPHLPVQNTLAHRN